MRLGRLAGRLAASPRLLAAASSRSTDAGAMAAHAAARQWRALLDPDPAPAPAWARLARRAPAPRTRRARPDRRPLRRPADDDGSGRRAATPPRFFAAAAASDASASDASPSLEDAPTLGEHARATGVVITSQANFLRVVVRPSDMSARRRRERREQFARAESRARLAGESADADALAERAADESAPVELLCVVRALLKKIKRRVLVGDGVELTGVDWVDRRAVIADPSPRRSALADPPVANVDMALLVFALERPPLEAKQLTRFLVSMEHAGVPFRLVLNKSDLASDDAKADWAARLNQWGYDPMFVSVATGEGVDELEALIAKRAPVGGGWRGDDDDGDDDGDTLGGGGDGEEEEDDDDDDDEEGDGGPPHVTVLAGPSGVGKSSLINRLRAGSRLAEALRDEMREMAETAEENEEEEEEEEEEEGTSDSGASDSGASDLGASDSDSSSDSSASSRVYVTDVDISGGGGGARGAVRVEGLSLQSVKSVSAKLGRGRHTTRHVTLLPLASGGLLADTPGFGYPSLDALTTSRLAECFPEIRRAREALGACKFADCTHRDEPGCAVDEAMPWEENRYEFYADLFDEVEAAEKAEREAGYKRETRVRYKSAGGASEKKKGKRRKGSGEEEGGCEGEGGEGSRGSRRAAGGGLRSRLDRSRGARGAGRRRMEPKLDTKSDRRQSRRAFNMETAEMGAEEEEEEEEEEEGLGEGVNPAWFEEEDGEGRR